MMRITIFLSCFALLLISNTSMAALGGARAALDDGTVDKRRIIIDTDMGLDDVRALFALLACRDLDILGLITVEGSASPGKALDHLVGLLESIHVDTLPVVMGAACPDPSPPPWREMANRLGGASFPPPHEITPIVEGVGWLEGMLDAHDRQIHYLALGPLTNPAALEQKHPGSLKKLKTLLIPVNVGPKGRIDEWNLTFDRASTRLVFKQAADIVLFDLSAFEFVDDLEFLSTLKGPAPAERWIQRVLKGGAENGAHALLYDELAAAAMIKPELMEKGDERFRFEVSDSGSFSIVSDEAGNIRVARFRHPSASLEHLRDFLGKTPPRRPAPTHQPAVSPKDLLKAFHGHLGPYVVLGYRMGKRALDAAGSDGHFGISAVVYSPLEPPKSCLIDGIQIGSGCTLGKRNIEARGIEGPAYVVFTPEGGNTVTVHLKAGIPALIKRLIEEKGVEAAGEDLLERDAAALFDLEITYILEGESEYRDR